MNEIQSIVKVEREISRSTDGKKAEVIGRLNDGPKRTFHIQRATSGSWKWRGSGSFVKVEM